MRIALLPLHSLLPKTLRAFFRHNSNRSEAKLGSFVVCLQLTYLQKTYEKSKWSIFFFQQYNRCYYVPLPLDLLNGLEIRLRSLLPCDNFMKWGDWAWHLYQLAFKMEQMDFMIFTFRFGFLWANRFKILPICHKIPGFNSKNQL